MSKVSLVILVIVISQALGQPLFLENKPVQCYDRECPNTTTACKRSVRTSEDKKSLNTEIYCLDAQDMVLKEYKESQDNPYGPSTSFQSTTFSGTYYSQRGGPFNIRINNNVDPDGNNQVEEFST